MPKHIAAILRRNKVLEWTDDENSQALVKHQLMEILDQRDHAADKDME